MRLRTAKCNIHRAVEPVFLKISSASISIPKMPVYNIILINEAEVATCLEKHKLFFIYSAITKALEACLEGTYTQFDSLTATTCCHGLAILARKLILELPKEDLSQILYDIKENISLLTSSKISNKDLFYFQNFLLPEPLITLTQLYILTIIKEKDYEKGWRTVSKKLNSLAPISTRFAHQLTKNLQCFFSNYVAESYGSYANSLSHEVQSNNASVKLWGEYVTEKYIRTDSLGRKYAPCLYSMQVSLGYLASTKAKIALVNDLRCLEEGSLKDRYVQILQGDGKGNFHTVNIQDNAIESLEPIIIFGGCTYSDIWDIDSYSKLITPWLSQFPSLVLFCDTYYPQFPEVRDDPNFNNDPIEPKEEELQKIIASHSKHEGFCYRKPLKFCLSHIYIASLQEIKLAIKSEDKSLLSESFIPSKIRNKSEL